jgi:predicted nuclease of predicted toxin-antitoxin system
VSRVKIDECLPSECSELLREKGHDVETVQQEGLQGAADLDVWIAA